MIAYRSDVTVSEKQKFKYREYLIYVGSKNRFVAPKLPIYNIDNSRSGLGYLGGNFTDCSDITIYRNSPYNSLYGILVGLNQFSNNFIIDDIDNSKIVNMGSTFMYTKINCNLFIPKCVNYCTWMLSGCYRFGSNIFFKGNLSTRVNNINAYGMLSGHNTSFPVYLHATPDMASLLYNTNLVSSEQLDWENIPGGWYNTRYNIYLYNNYSG